MSLRDERAKPATIRTIEIEALSEAEAKEKASEQATADEKIIDVEAI